MDLRFTEEEENFRTEVRDWLDENVPRERYLHIEDLTKHWEEVRDFQLKLGKKGWFSLVAGLNARRMAAEHTMGIKEFYECCIPAPADPPGTCRALKTATGYDMAICDINDIAPAWCVASTLSKERVRLLERSFDDNPLGQTDEQTPIGIWREVEPPPISASA